MKPECRLPEPLPSSVTEFQKLRVMCGDGWNGTDVKRGEYSSQARKNIPDSVDTLFQID